MKKKIGYFVFAGVYMVCRLLCTVRPRKIVLFNGHNYGLNGNLLAIYEAMKKKGGYRFVIRGKRDMLQGSSTGARPGILKKIGGSCRFFLELPYQMATAEKVFLNDNFLPLAYMRTSPSTQFIQLWHGAGAFKRFGLSTEKDEEVYRLVSKANQRITHLFVTSQKVIPCYEEAFAIPSDRIYATGLPVTELYFDEKRMAERKKIFYDKNPFCKNKKILLYTPTFRSGPEENNEILRQFQVEKIHEILGEDWMILIKMHPKFPVHNIPENNFCRDMTEYNNISDLYLVADLLITDYSSAVVEFALLDKPVILFAYDLYKYDRGFYFDYETMVPGEVAHDQEELYAILQGKWNNLEKRQNFVKFQYDNISGGASERILEILDK